jgi:hypothetical protein
MRICFAIALVVSTGVIAALAVGAAARGGRDDGDRFAARLVGYHEVNGSFRAKLVDETLEYTLTFSNLETASLFAHIHFAEKHVNGTVTGVIDPADVIGPADHGIEAGSFEELVRAMRSDATYANVHSTRFPGGEIRGQTGGGGRGGDHGNHDEDDE